MKIGDLEIHGHAALAPMAGVADRALRELCVSYGAAYVIHSAQKRHVRTAVLTGLCCLALAGLYALWLWITLA